MWKENIPFVPKKNISWKEINFVISVLRLRALLQDSQLAGQGVTSWLFKFLGILTYFLLIQLSGFSLNGLVVLCVEAAAFRDSL